jgi:hypothetical protein
MGGRIMTAEGDPMLAELLKEVPRLRTELSGWAAGYLVPILAAFHEGATDSQIATALSNLSEVLRARAGTDDWLRRLANLGPRAKQPRTRSMDFDTKLPPNVSLPPDRIPIRNRTIVEQARELREALAPPPSARTKPDTK